MPDSGANGTERWVPRRARRPTERSHGEPPAPRAPPAFPGRRCIRVKSAKRGQDFAFPAPSRRMLPAGRARGHRSRVWLPVGAGGQPREPGPPLALPATLPGSGAEQLGDDDEAHHDLRPDHPDLGGQPGRNALEPHLDPPRGTTEMRRDLVRRRTRRGRRRARGGPPSARSCRNPGARHRRTRSSVHAGMRCSAPHAPASVPTAAGRFGRFPPAYRRAAARRSAMNARTASRS